MRSAKVTVVFATGAIVLIIGGMALAIYYLADSRKGARLVNEGYAAELRGDYDNALILLSQGLQHKLTRHDLSIAYQNRGFAYNWKWKFDDAIHDYTEAVRLNPKLTDAYLGRALAYNRKAQGDKAIDDLSKAIELDSNSYSAYLNRGLLFLQNNKPDRALPDFDEAVRCNPSSADPLVMRGLCYVAKNDLDHALASLDGAIFVDPMNAIGYMERANLYLRKGEREKAERDREHARSLSPKAEEASNNLAFFLSQKLGATTVSPAWATHAGKGYSEVFREANEASDAGDLDRAIELYNVVMAMDITAIQAAPALMNRANAYRAKGDANRALLDYDQALRLNPHNAGAYVDRALALKAKGKREAAMEDYAAAIRLNPNQWQAYFNRASDFRDEGQLEEALSDLGKTIELNPRFAGGYINRAGIYLRKGEIDIAISDLNKAIEIDPNSPKPYIVRANAWVGKKEYAAAERDLEKVTQLDTKRPAAALNSLAWLRAVCPERSSRNGPKAVEAATKACELTHWKDWGCIDTLAAAYAESGNFTEAVKFEKQALQLTEDRAEVIAKAKQRLELYEHHKPYREEPDH